MDRFKHITIHFRPGRWPGNWSTRGLKSTTRSTGRCTGVRSACLVWLAKWGTTMCHLSPNWPLLSGSEGKLLLWLWCYDFYMECWSCNNCSPCVCFWFMVSSCSKSVQYLCVDDLPLCGLPDLIFLLYVLYQFQLSCASLGMQLGLIYRTLVFLNVFFLSG